MRTQWLLLRLLRSRPISRHTASSSQVIQSRSLSNLSHPQKFQFYPVEKSGHNPIFRSKSQVFRRFSSSSEVLDVENQESENLGVQETKEFEAVDVVEKIESESVGFGDIRETEKFVDVVERSESGNLSFGEIKETEVGVVGNEESENVNFGEVKDSEVIGVLENEEIEKLDVLGNNENEVSGVEEKRVTKSGSDPFVVLSQIFSEGSLTIDEVKHEFCDNGIVISHEFVISALENLHSQPEVARRFFGWVLEVDGDKLSSKTYNLMLEVLGGNGYVNEFWDLVEDMKKKGYGVTRATSVKVLEKFEEDGLEEDVQKLKDLYAFGSTDSSVENLAARVRKIIRRDVWGDNVEAKIRELDIGFSSDLVRLVVENIGGTEPNKALIFFRWVEEAGLFKHDEMTYNALAQVLAREDYADKFWKVIDEKRAAGYEMDKGTYVKAFNHFIRKKMMKDAVDLYELAMFGSEKPAVRDCTFLLKKIVTRKELDMELFSKVVRVFKDGGNTLTSTTLDAVLKSLTSVGRFGECNKIVNAMEEGGFVPNGRSQSKIAFDLGKHGKDVEANEFLDNMKASGSGPQFTAWASLVEGHCVAGRLDKALDSFHKMLEKEGTSSAGYAFQKLINAYCSKGSAFDAYKILSEMVTMKELRPWQATYKLLMSKLVVQGGFKDALNLLRMMKKNTYPPFLDPFIEYVTKSGTRDDAVMFLKAISGKKYPSEGVYIQIFEAYSKYGRISEAQDFLAKCPRAIRDNSDVLNILHSMKSRRTETRASISA